MALKYWIGGAGEKRYDRGENWDGGSPPSSGDVAVLGGDHADGPSHILGINYTSLGAHSIIVGSKWSGDFGSNLNAAGFDLTSLDYAGSGVAKIRRYTSTTANVNIRMTGKADRSNHLGESMDALSVHGETPITNVRILGGHQVRFGNPECVITTAEVIGAGRVEVDFFRSSITPLKCNSGDIEFATCENLEMSGEAAVAARWASASGTYAGSVDMYGGTLRWDTPGAVASIKSGLRVFSGLFDASGCSSGSVNINNAEVFANGVIDERGAAADITWANGVRIHGGIFKCDGGRVVTPT